MNETYKKYAILIGIGFILGIWFAGTVYLILRQVKPAIKEVVHKVKDFSFVSQRHPKTIMVLDDFEDRGDLERWSIVSAHISISYSHIVSGEKSAKLQYYPAKGAAAVKMERFFETRQGKRLGNWSGYAYLRFDLYNPTDNNRRIILQIKDADETRYKRNIYLAPKEVTRVEIGINELKDILDVSRIRQFNLFMWNPKESFVCYLDNIRLAPEEGEPEHVGQNQENKDESRNASEGSSLSENKGLIMLSDFEKDGDFRIWRGSDASLVATDTFHTHGSKGARVTMKGGVKCPKVLIDKFFETKEGKKFGDWRGLNTLKFDLYNPTENNTRLILQIKDADGTRYKRNIYIVPREVTKVEIGIDELKDILDVSRIRQFNLFRWKPKEQSTFYIDNLRVEGQHAASLPEAALPVLEEHKRIGGKTLSESYLVGVANSIDKIFKDKDKFKGKWDDNYSIFSARNEHEGFQIAIYSSNKVLHNVKVKISDFFEEGRQYKLDKDNIKWYLIKFVKTRRPDYTVPYTGWIPDPIEPVNLFDVPAGEMQPILVDFYIPESTQAGIYTGYVKIIPENDTPKTVKVTVHVWDFSLPKRMHLKTAFDDYPWRLKFGHEYLNELSGNDYKREVRNLIIDYHLKMLEYRISPILNLSREDLILARKLKLYLEHGLNAFAIGKYNGSSGNNWPKDDSSLQAIVSEYKQFAYRLRQLGVMGLAYIYTFDEPKVGDPFVEKVCRIVHEADPELKNVVVLHDVPNIKVYKDWFKNIDIVCLRNAGLSRYLTDQLKNMDKEIWIYVSGPSYSYPTLVIDFKGIMYRVIPWSAWRYGADGLLYWCVNYWTKNPWKDPMNTKWGQNGNGSLFYPGDRKPLGSLRLEILRDGIEDYEYLYILKEKIKSAKGKGLNASWGDVFKKAERLLNIEDIVRTAGDYTKDSDQLLERRRVIGETIEELNRLISKKGKKISHVGNGVNVTEDFSKPIITKSGKQFGKDGAFTFELFRGGTFVIDGKSGYALQKSDSYRDSAFIRSTHALPETYKVSATVGDIEYDLSNIEKLSNDPDYKEGPRNENGVYLLAITDEAPIGHHTNDWWHQHRKVCIDVDNNIWGAGMPHPIFMVYFNNGNELAAFNGKKDMWTTKWEKAVTYKENDWYTVEVEKTKKKYILRIFDKENNILKEAGVDIADVWHGDSRYPDYFVIGDPHENYYQGSFKIKSISLR